MSNFEKKCLEFLEKHRVIIFLVLISIAAFIARICLLNYESADYEYFLSPWFQYLKSHGGLSALKSFPGNYNAPYMTIMALLTYLPFKTLYLIKSVSIVFDFVLAILSAKLVYKIAGDNKKWLSYITYALVLFMPQVLINSAFWAQCDSMYASFCILALILLLDKKYTKAFIALGFAFAFKLQFIFILPIFIILYFSKKEFSILNFLIIPLVNFILCIPAMIAGKPIIDCMLIYSKQADTYNKLQLNFINIYRFITNESNYIRTAGLIVTLVICMLTLFYVLEKKIKWNNEKIITLALWFLVIITFTLPSMHDRYLYVGEVLSIIYYIRYRKNGALVTIINLNAIVNYSNFLFWNPDVDCVLLAVIYLFTLLHFTKNTFKLLNDKN